MIQQARSWRTHVHGYRYDYTRKFMCFFMRNFVFMDLSKRSLYILNRHYVKRTAREVIAWASLSFCALIKKIVSVSVLLYEGTMHYFLHPLPPTGFWLMMTLPLGFKARLRIFFFNIWCYTCRTFPWSVHGKLYPSEGHCIRQTVFRAQNNFVLYYTCVFPLTNTLHIDNMLYSMSRLHSS